jgi:hypothetical protein
MNKSSLSPENYSASNLGCHHQFESLRINPSR